MDGIKQKRIVLVDGKQLTELMLTHNLGVSTKQVFEVKALDSDYFRELISTLGVLVGTSTQPIKRTLNNGSTTPTRIKKAALEYC
jgi:hypothetical protein